MKRLLREFTKGIFSENPIFVIVLGLCPALAVSVSLENALGMGIGLEFVGEETRDCESLPPPPHRIHKYGSTGFQPVLHGQDARATASS